MQSYVRWIFAEALGAFLIATSSIAAVQSDPSPQAVPSENSPSQSAPPGDRMTPPRRLGGADADCRYPPEAVKTRSEGASVMRAHIDEQGAPSQISVATSSGSTILDDAAVRCLTGSRFQPATRNGAAIAMDWSTRITWKLPAPTCEAAAQASADRAHEPSAPSGKELAVCLCYDDSGKLRTPRVMSSSTGNSDFDTRMTQALSERSRYSGVAGCQISRAKIADKK